MINLSSTTGWLGILSTQTNDLAKLEYHTLNFREMDVEIYELIQILILYITHDYDDIRILYEYFKNLFGHPHNN